VAKQQFLKQYQIFLIKAKEDFAAAKYLYNGFKNDEIDLNISIICFHLQQSVEKTLKATLDYYNIKFPHSHDIEDLLNIITDNNITLIDNVRNLERLTDYAVDWRYSIIHDDIKDSEKYFTLINELIDFVTKMLEGTVQ